MSRANVRNRSDQSQQDGSITGTTLPYRGEEIDASSFLEAFTENRLFRLLNVKIKLVDHCNARCIKCLHWRRSPKKQRIRQERALLPEDWLRVADELVQAGCKRVVFTGGEPTLSPILPRMVKRLDAGGVTSGVITNGSTLSLEYAEDLVGAGVREFTFSIDGSDATTHDRIVGITGAFDRLLSGVRNVRIASQNLHIPVRVHFNTVVMRYNYDRLDGIFDLARDYGVCDVRLSPVEDDYLPDKLRLDRRTVRHFSLHVFPRLKEKSQETGVAIFPSNCSPYGATSRQWNRAAQGEYSLGMYEYIPCFWPWLHATIDYMGDVYVCCRNCSPPFHLGAIREQSLVEVLTSTSARSIRMQCKPPIQSSQCKKCSMTLRDNIRLARVLGYDVGESPF